MKLLNGSITRSARDCCIYAKDSVIRRSCRQNRRRRTSRVTGRSRSRVLASSIAFAPVFLCCSCRVGSFTLSSTRHPRAHQLVMGHASSSSSANNPISLNPESTATASRMGNDDKPIVSPVISEQRVVPVVSWPVFAVTASLLPVWAVTVLPLSIFYQAGKSLVRKLTRKEPSIPSYDSGYEVDPSLLVQRSERKYDVVVLGVTGFCGRLSAAYLAKTYGMDGRKVKWAMAGRSRAKLEQVRAEIASELGIAEDEVKVDMIVADTSDPATLPDLVRQTRVVASTAGPFILLGNHVVEFCAAFGTHYVDITGEVDWVKSMHGLWHDTATKTGSKIVSFCGHDSIPWDLSMLKVQQAMTERSDKLKSVTFWNEVVGGAPGGTFATMLTFLDGNVRPPPVAYNPFVRNQAGAVSANTLTARLPAIPSLADSPWDGTSSGVSRRWQAPFVMAVVNSQICQWSHALQSSGNSSAMIHNITYSESVLYPDFKSAFVGYMSLFVLLSFAANPVTRPLLQSAIPQQGSGPDAVKMDTAHFLCVYSVGEGEKGTRVETCMYFPKDAGCVETARMLMESALCLAFQEDKLGSSQGGFWTPATAMGDGLMDRLLKTGTSFQRRVVQVTE